MKLQLLQVYAELAKCFVVCKYVSDHLQLIMYMHLGKWLPQIIESYQAIIYLWRSCGLQLLCHNF